MYIWMSSSLRGSYIFVRHLCSRKGNPAIWRLMIALWQYFSNKFHVSIVILSQLSEWVADNQEHTSRMYCTCSACMAQMPVQTLVDMQKFGLVQNFGKWIICEGTQCMEVRYMQYTHNIHSGHTVYMHVSCILHANWGEWCMSGKNVGCLQLICLHATNSPKAGHAQIILSYVV